MHSRVLTLVLGSMAIAGCSGDGVQSITTPVSGAQIRFSNFAVAAPPLAAVPPVNFYANDAKITAITSGTGSESTLGTGTGGAGNGGFYSVLAPGSYTVTGRVASTVDNGLAIATVPAVLADGKFYSMYMSGNYNSTSKSTDAFVLEDLLPARFDYSTSYVRFVNASANAGSASLVVRNTTSGVEAAVGAAAAYQSATAFVAVPAGVYDLILRGASSTLVTQKAVSLLAGRVYSASVFGDATVTSASAGNRIRFDIAANR